MLIKRGPNGEGRCLVGWGLCGGSLQPPLCPPARSPRPTGSLVPPTVGQDGGLPGGGGQEEEEEAAFAPERRRQICSLPHAVVT